MKSRNGKDTSFTFRHVNCNCDPTRLTTGSIHPEGPAELGVSALPWFKIHIYFIPAFRSPNEQWCHPLLTLHHDTTTTTTITHTFLLAPNLPRDSPHTSTHLTPPRPPGLTSATDRGAHHKLPSPCTTGSIAARRPPFIGVPISSVLRAKPESILRAWGCI